MDELCTWFEIIRSLLPPSYDMRLTPGRCILIWPADGMPIYLTREDLAGRKPIAVMESLKGRMRKAHTARAAC